MSSDLVDGELRRRLREGTVHRMRIATAARIRVRSLAALGGSESIASQVFPDGQLPRKLYPHPRRSQLGAFIDGDNDAMLFG